MNPMLAHWLRPDAPVYERPLALAAVENSGTEYDRAFIAAQNRTFDNEMLIYRRAPRAGEWANPLPAGAEVEVYVINDWTTVRVLQDGTGERLCEPVIDCWLVQPLVQAA